MTVENEELSDTDLFNGAVTEPEGEEQQQTEQPVTTETETVAATETPAEKPEVDDNAPLVPSWRLREVNEERRTLADRLAALEAEKATWQRPQEAPKVETAKPSRPDPLLDPDGYASAVRDEARQEMLAERREDSLQRARKANPKDFDEAYSTALKAIDPALKARMQASRDPGETLLEWHRENKVKAEVGHDPNAWLEKKLEERLKDPAFLAKAVELARGSASNTTQQPNGKPRVELPPSLSGASRASQALRSQDNQDESDRELFEKIAG